MHQLTQIALTKGLTGPQAAIFYAIALEGEIERRGLHRFLCITDKRTVNKALKALKETGIIGEENGKISVKLQGFHQIPNVHARASTLPNGNGLTCSNPLPLDGNGNFQTLSNDIGGTDAGASDPHNSHPAKAALGSEIRIGRDYQINIGDDAEGMLVCHTKQLRTREGFEMFMEIWNRRFKKSYDEDMAKYEAIEGEKGEFEFGPEHNYKRNVDFVKWIAKKSTKKQPTAAWITARYTKHKSIYAAQQKREAARKAKPAR